VAVDAIVCIVCIVIETAYRSIAVERNLDLILFEDFSAA
jgi:hypothetical protein